MTSLFLDNKVKFDLISTRQGVLHTFANIFLMGIFIWTPRDVGRIQLQWGNIMSNFITRTLRVKLMQTRTPVWGHYWLSFKSWCKWGPAEGLMILVNKSPWKQGRLDQIGFTTIFSANTGFYLWMKYKQTHFEMHKQCCGESRVALLMKTSQRRTVAEGSWVSKNLSFWRLWYSYN